MTVAHGTTSRYSNNGCRCDDCRAANAASQRRYRHDVKGRLPMGAYLLTLRRTHGIRSTYKNGCRCEPCRAAETAYMRSYRASKAVS